MAINQSTPIGSIVYYTYGTSILSALLCSWTLDKQYCILFGLQKENRRVMNPAGRPGVEIFACFTEYPDNLYLEPRQAIDGDCARWRAQLERSLECGMAQR